MSEAKDRYWFPAKRYGWGWGLPSRWQGWVVLLGFLALSMSGQLVFPLPAHVLGYVLYQVVLVAALLAICWKTGEPPRWRWGDQSKDSRP
jgi:hypothetical protein